MLRTRAPWLVPLALACSAEPEPRFDPDRARTSRVEAEPSSEAGAPALPAEPAALEPVAPPNVAEPADPAGAAGASGGLDAKSPALDLALDPALEEELVSDAQIPALAVESDDSVFEAIPELLATAREVFVLERPSASAKKLGYLRAGARLPRSPEPRSFDGCPGGFYRVAPEGYVCAGEFARTDLDHPLSRLGRVRPDRDAPLPYAYARSGPLPPVRYTRLPKRDDLLALEPEYRPRAPRELPGLVSQPTPPELQGGRSLPAPYGRYEPTTSNTGRPPANSSFALLESYVHDGRSFALSADYLLLSHDRLEPVKPSSFQGLLLDGVDLPVAFVMRRGSKLYAGQPAKGLRIARSLDYREALPLTGQRAKLGSTTFREVVGGDWLRDEHLIEVTPAPELPSFARGNTTWIRISISTQTLVAYEGERPVYVTLVSTGADGAGDPKTTRSTVQGQFRIHTKHVTARMANDDPDDTYDHRDVPWVAYFSEGYALHAAYWHDAFGTPKSHGCVNLSPADARWLFQWTEPSVPRAWHGAIRAGTRVVVVP